MNCGLIAGFLLFQDWLVSGAMCNISDTAVPTPTAGNGEGAGAVAPQCPEGPQDFSKLKLKSEQLLGSRWAVEQKKVIDVYHAIEVVDATLVNKDELSLRIEFNLRQYWVADGLVFPEGLFKKEDPPNSYVTAKESVLASMWSPDSYISSARASQMNTVGTPLSLVYIFKNTSIIYKARMFTKVACSSSFQWYPLDIQSCDLTIESYKYHDDLVRYNWTDENLYRPVVVQNRRLYQYELRTPVKYDAGTATRGGRGMGYPFVRVKFIFERKLGNNLIQVYTPTVLVVVLSWFSFWLGLDAIPGRVSLLVTCMLTLVTMHSGMKTSIPPVHYITMMDVWYVCCMGFVFSAMCEFVVVKYIFWRNKQREEDKNEVGRGESETRARLYSILKREENKTRSKVIVNDDCKGDIAQMGEGENGQVGKAEIGAGGETGVQSEPSKKLAPPLWISMDKLCRSLFPVLFCIFNGGYWPLLLWRGGALEQEIYSDI